MGVLVAALTALPSLAVVGLVLLALVLFCPWRAPFKRLRTLLKLVLDRPRRPRRARRARRDQR